MDPAGLAISLPVWCPQYHGLIDSVLSGMYAKMRGTCGSTLQEEETGWPDWENFRLLADLFPLAVF
jgi:hypothetical protein